MLPFGFGNTLGRSRAHRIVHVGVNGQSTRKGLASHQRDKFADRAAIRKISVCTGLMKTPSMSAACCLPYSSVSVYCEIWLDVFTLSQALCLEMAAGTMSRQHVPWSRLARTKQSAIEMG